MIDPILGRLRDALEESGKGTAELVRDGVAKQQTISKWKNDDTTKPTAESVAQVVVKLGLNGHWLLTGERGTTGKADYQAGVRATCKLYEDLCRVISGVAEEKRLDAQLAEIRAELAEMRRQLPPGGHRRADGG